MDLRLKDLHILSRRIKGEVESDLLHRVIYATDASAYREMPLGVVYPKDASDVKEIVKFVRENEVGLIPRAAGTSLAGQVVGDGLVVDISRHMNRILELNVQEKWVRVEPGVVLEALHSYTKPYGLFFGPETSTSNRCCMGGMVREIILAGCIRWYTAVSGIICWKLKWCWETERRSC